MGKNVLILIPDGWYLEECCVKKDRTTAPTAALVLAAYLRNLGHNPLVAVHPVGKRQQISMSGRLDAVVVYSPWYAFPAVSAPVFEAFKEQSPRCMTILVMYESLADFEVQAMRRYPTVDYAVLPNEKEISVGVVLESDGPRCPGGFGERAGIVYRGEDGVPRHDGKRPFANDLWHLPYSGHEMTEFLERHQEQSYTKTAVLLERGCPQTCSFCPLRCTRSRYREPGVAARELALASRLFGPSGVSVLTHEVLHKRARLEEFVDLAIAGNVRSEMTLGTRCDLVDDVVLPRKLRQAGVTALYFGIEAATEEGRVRLGKPIADSDIERAINLADQAGLGFHAAFIVGFPWEDENYMATMKDYLRKLAHHRNFLSIRLSRLIPYPGLPIEKELLREGILERAGAFDDWNFRPEELWLSCRRTTRMDTATLNRWYDALCPAEPTPHASGLL
jgi:radical SAM superfamily enzyme YgiQ (UPF0313 family)